MRISDKASEVLSQGRAGGSLKADLLPNGKPIYDEDPSTTMKVAVATFVILPTLALVLFVPVSSWLGFGPSLLDVGMLVGMYCITCAGVGAGFHRYFTHGSYKATRGLKIALAICGSLALQGPLI
jgi:stearoyl-CoA desaturase (delta-9 desaturase)